MAKLKNAFMMAVCALVLSFFFLIFAVLALVSETARFIIEETMAKTADIFIRAENMSLERHRMRGHA